MIPVLAVAGLVLVSAPALVTARRGHPAHWTRYALVGQLTGFALVEAALLLWAVPALLDLVSATDLALVCRRMLGGQVPGGWPVGAAAGATALSLAGLGLRGAWRVRSVQRKMRVEPWLGVHHRHRDHQVVVLTTPVALAYTVGGRPPQVVVSRGLIDAVGAELTAAICAHESVHARYRHHRMVAASAAISSAFGWLPPVRSAGARVRLLLERWADEEAATVTAGGRAAVRRALLAVSLPGLAPEVAAFGSADTIAERVRALSESAPPRSSRRTVVAGYVTASLAVGVATGSLAWATAMTFLAVTNPGLCVL